MAVYIIFGICLFIFIVWAVTVDSGERSEIMYSKFSVLEPKEKLFIKDNFYGNIIYYWYNGSKVKSYYFSETKIDLTEEEISIMETLAEKGILIYDNDICNAAGGAFATDWARGYVVDRHLAKKL